jgi:fatty-acyl-CoA synthase
MTQLDSFAALTPVLLLDRAAAGFADRTAVEDGDVTFNYRELAQRCERLAGGLHRLGIRPGDRVAALCTNSHVMLELHFGVLLAGAVLVPLNTRLARQELKHIVEHSGARLIVASREFDEAAADLAASCRLLLVVEGSPTNGYEELLADAAPLRVDVADERSLMSINYTSGTTGLPKGVMYAHRGAYLQSVAMAYHHGLGPGSRYLWTLPMFHCHGWSFPFAVTGAGGTHVCLRTMDVGRVWEEIRAGVTHFSAAPTVLSMIAEHPAAGTGARDAVSITTGGAPPSPALLRRMTDLNLRVTHAYGLTETYGPVMVNQWQPEWDLRSPAEQAATTARQGIANLIALSVRVVDGSGADVPADGSAVGELVVRGNNVMLGYYKDQAATRGATLDGWLRTGDLAVMHPDGYAEIRDRLKDVIISGGENIASVEVERVIADHPDVSETAVVGWRDEHWGQIPVAYVTLRPGAQVDAEEIQAHVRRRLAGYKVPKTVVFSELPKTATGKIQKNRLRELQNRDDR